MHGLNYPPDIPRLGPQKPLRQPKRKFWLGQICTKCRPVHVAASGSTNPSAHGQLGPAAAAENPAEKSRTKPNCWTQFKSSDQRNIFDTAWHGALGKRLLSYEAMQANAHATYMVYCMRYTYVVVYAQSAHRNASLAFTFAFVTFRAWTYTESMYILTYIYYI